MPAPAVAAGLQLFPRPRRRFACRDLAWDYGIQVSRSSKCLLFLLPVFLLPYYYATTKSPTFPEPRSYLCRSYINTLYCPKLSI